ncbi:MAG: transglycosylase SLT domain-containing protein, partial [Gammaproteobacteria bacterium]|nr:transglycosylase SLT domain-containing protein [Gammaproteobacteria bacterium]
MLLLFTACQQVGVVPETQQAAIETSQQIPLAEVTAEAPDSIQPMGEPTTLGTLQTSLTDSPVQSDNLQPDRVQPEQLSDQPITALASTPSEDKAEPNSDNQLDPLAAVSPQPDTTVVANHTPVTKALLKPAPQLNATAPPASEHITKVDALVEAQPLVVSAALTPPPPAPVLDLWQLTVASYNLTRHTNPRIKTHVAWYSKHTEYMQRVTKRSSRYYHYVLHQVLAADMPAEIALLPIVESGFDTFAYSHGRAAGAWQFIPSTGRMFGLNQTWWYDGRRDVVASTAAAIKYLQQLHAMFDGDWLLALAAYNSGPGTVSKAIRANTKQGKATDYWSLSLPTETMHYVPKLLGLSQVVATNAGTDKLTSVENKPYFAIVDTGSQIDLAQAAELADISVEEIYRLNPGYNQWATDPQGPHRLLVPMTSASKFRQGLADLPADQRVAWQRYIIQPGDSLLKLSKRHHVSVDLIRSLNNLQDNTIIAGKPLMIPMASKNAETYSLSAAQRILKRQQQLSATHASNR